MIKINKGFRIYGGDYDIQEVANGVKIRIDDKEERFDFSSLVSGEEYTVTDCLILPYMPITGIKIKDDGEIEVQAFFDDWYKTNPQQFNRAKIEYSLVPTADNNLELVKEKQSAIILGAFETEFQTGHFASLTLGIEVDCRRGGIKNDLQNVEGLITDYDNLTEAEKHYKGYTETTSSPLTLAQLISLKQEMSQWGRALYKKKWSLEESINNSTTITEVKSIVW